MRPYLLYSPSRNELAVLSSVMDFLMKKRGALEIPDCVQKLTGLECYAADPGQLKMMVCDVTTEGIIPILEQLRLKNPGFQLVLIADATVSPVRYIRPTILPTSLLWRPVQPEGVKDTLWEILAAIPTGEQEDSKDDDRTFSVEVRGDVRRIPYKDILFFEARNKRLNLHMNRKEIPFPGTLEKLMEELPEEFIRVHKSFIVNRRMITEIQYGQNTIILEGGIMVPVSRSYKATLKEVFS